MVEWGVRGQLVAGGCGISDGIVGGAWAPPPGGGWKVGPPGSWAGGPPGTATC